MARPDQKKKNQPNLQAPHHCPWKRAFSGRKREEGCEMLWIRKVAYQISATPPVPGADRSLFLAHRTAGAGEGATGREAKPSLRRRNLQDAREIKPKNGKNLIDFGEGEQTQQKGRGRNLCSRAHGPLVDQFRWVISRVSGLNASELLVKIRVIPPQITGLRFQVISYHPRSLRYRETSRNQSTIMLTSKSCYWCIHLTGTQEPGFI